MRASLIAAFLCAGVLATAQTVKLQPKFPLGRTDRVTTVTHVVQSFSIPGTNNPAQMTLDQSIGLLVKVVSANSQGATMKMTYEEIRSAMTVNGTKIDQGSEAQKAMKGKSISLVFGPDSKLKKVNGLTELVNSNKLSPQGKAVLQQLLNEESIKQMWATGLSGMAPGKPIKVGDSWTSAVTMGQQPMKISLKMKMHLDKVSGNFAFVSIKGTGTAQFAGVSGANVSLKTKQVNVGGTYTFDTARGWMKEQNLLMTMSGTVVAESQGKRQESTFSSKITSKTISKPLN
ncbi:MAG: hypothetical protein JSS66_16910 [Armatimonadetes bacterium]|nr:hypothetical protein [Armatimonadota bacterium]